MLTRCYTILTKLPYCGATDSGINSEFSIISCNKYNDDAIVSVILEFFFYFTNQI